MVTAPGGPPPTLPGYRPPPGAAAALRNRISPPQGAPYSHPARGLPARAAAGPRGWARPRGTGAGEPEPGTIHLPPPAPRTRPPPRPGAPAPTGRQRAVRRARSAAGAAPARGWGSLGGVSGVSAQRRGPAPPPPTCATGTRPGLRRRGCRREGAEPRGGGGDTTGSCGPSPGALPAGVVPPLRSVPIPPPSLRARPAGGPAAARVKGPPRWAGGERRHCAALSPAPP